MEMLMSRILIFALALGTLSGCEELLTPQPRTGNYEVDYMDNLRVYIGDELVAEVVSGEDADITWDGETFQVSTLCSDEGTDCPGEVYWREVAVDQPWGDGYKLLNFVNLDGERGTLGQRMGGTLQEDGTFSMLSGLALGGKDNCAALGVGTVEGKFNAANTAIGDGVIALEWAAGCQVGEVTIGTTLRLETDFTAARTGDLDLSSVTPDEPIDEDGDVVDPDAPDDEYATE
jgi:hypothetical protein